MRTARFSCAHPSPPSFLRNTGIALVSSAPRGWAPRHASAERSCRFLETSFRPSGAKHFDIAGGLNWPHDRLMAKTRHHMIASLAAAWTIASPGAAQQPAFRPSLQKCPPRSAVNIPALPVSSAPLADQFDLSYSTRSDGIMEVSLTSKTGGGSLLFVGVAHVSSPDAKIFDYLETTVSNSKPSAIYLEVADVSYLSKLPLDKSQVIRTRGEPSYLGFIARQANIPVLPMEPDPAQLLTRLGSRYGADDISLAFVLRDVQIARDRRRLYGETLEDQARRALQSQGELTKSTGNQSSLNNVLQLTQAVNQRWHGLDWRQVPAEWFNPMLNSNDTGSIFINSLFKEEMLIRDQHALNVLLSQALHGERVIALAGRSHAEMQLQTLNCLMAQR